MFCYLRLRVSDFNHNIIRSYRQLTVHFIPVTTASSVVVCADNNTWYAASLVSTSCRHSLSPLLCVVRSVKPNVRMIASKTTMEAFLWWSPFVTMMNTSMILRQRALQLQRISYFFTYKRYYGGTRYTVNDLRRQGDRVYKLFYGSLLW